MVPLAAVFHGRLLCSNTLRAFCAFARSPHGGGHSRGRLTAPDAIASAAGTLSFFIGLPQGLGPETEAFCRVADFNMTKPQWSNDNLGVLGPFHTGYLARCRKFDAMGWQCVIRPPAGFLSPPKSPIGGDSNHLTSGEPLVDAFFIAVC